MVLAGVDLLYDPACAGPVPPHEYEQIFCNKTQFRIGLHDLDVREALLVRADFVLVLDDQHTAVAQYPLGLLARIGVQFQNGIVIFGCRSIPRSAIPIVIFKGLMDAVR